MHVMIRKSYTCMLWSGLSVRIWGGVASGHCTCDGDCEHEKREHDFVWNAKAHLSCACGLKSHAVCALLARVSGSLLVAV